VRSTVSSLGRAPIGGWLLLYLAASLLHFAHNAEYLADYPNLPPWLGRSDIYLVWIGQAVVGVGGYMLYRARGWAAGLLLIGLYASLGFDGLLHYTRAPMAEHTAAMNITIGFEVAAAGLLLIRVIALLTRATQLRRPHP
jgi:hypothetical protein